MSEAVRGHSTHRFVFENRGETSVLLCECGRPFLDIVNGEVIVASKHGSAKHENVLTLENLRTIAFEIYRQTHPPERW